MNITVRLTETLYKEVEADLLRPHPFAVERVGFIMARLGNRNTENPLILFSKYQPVMDEHYVDTHDAGARINGAAIRSAMQSVLDADCGAFHVHLHLHRGLPRFSQIDKKSIPSVVRALRLAGSNQAHGMFLLSRDSGIARIWLPGNERPHDAAKITVVGFPMTRFN